MYLLGEGVPSNSAEGLRWLRLAADQGEESCFRATSRSISERLLRSPGRPCGALCWERRICRLLSVSSLQVRQERQDRRPKANSPASHGRAARCRSLCRTKILDNVFEFVSGAVPRPSLH